MLLHIGAEHLDLAVLRGRRLHSGWRQGAAGQKRFEEIIERLLLFQRGRIAHKRVVQGTEGVHELALRQKVARETGRLLPAGDLPCGTAHNVGWDVDRAVVQRFAAYRGAAVAVVRIEKHKVAGRYIVFLSPAPQMAPAAFDEADDIILVEVVGEFLHDALQVISFYAEHLVVADGTGFIRHDAASFHSLQTV